MMPCWGAYHSSCITVGAPFTTRRNNNAGLVFPNVEFWPNFVCEVCTVRSVLGRELTSPGDQQLLVLERIRMIDIACSWSSSTHTNYQSQLRHIRRFERKHGLTVLHTPKLLRPSSAAIIPMQWYMESHSLRLATHSSRDMRPAPIAFGSVRSLRSATAQFYQAHASIAFPDSSFLNKEGRLIYQKCRPTDAVAMRMFASGMATRMGTASKPSTALLERHVQMLDNELHTQFVSCSPSLKRTIALAGFANVVLWLTWVRSSELFSLTFADVQGFAPHLWQLHDLHFNCGMLSFQLLPETKSSPTEKADILIAHHTQSGFSPLIWWNRVCAHSMNATAVTPIFLDDADEPWTSKTFRQNFLYPSLHRQKVTDRDPYLQGSITAAFWSLHSYRRGGRTQVDKAALSRHPDIPMSLIKQMVYEHGRWKLNRSSMEIDIMYREWTPQMRLYLTLLFF